jgi:hypothetical protein
MSYGYFLPSSGVLVTGDSECSGGGIEPVALDFGDPSSTQRK